MGWPFLKKRGFSEPWMFYFIYCVMWSFVKSQLCSIEMWLSLYCLYYLFLDIYVSTGEVLGEGSFGQVITHRNINTGKEFAVKVWSCFKLLTFCQFEKLFFAYWEVAYLYIHYPSLLPLPLFFLSPLFLSLQHQASLGSAVSGLGWSLVANTVWCILR